MLTLVTDTQDDSFVTQLNQNYLGILINFLLVVISLMFLCDHFCYGYTRQSETTTQPEPYQEERWKKAGLLGWFQLCGAKVSLGFCLVCAEQNKGELHGNCHYDN